MAAGYKTAEGMAAEIAAVRAGTTEPFGVNVFVPGIPAADRGAVDAYLDTLASDAQAVEAALGASEWDDDDFDGKVSALLADPPAVGELRLRLSPE